jgi:hypothetical protein
MWFLSCTDNQRNGMVELSVSRDVVVARVGLVVYKDISVDSPAVESLSGCAWGRTEC